MVKKDSSSAWLRLARLAVEAGELRRSSRHLSSASWLPISFDCTRNGHLALDPNDYGSVS
ncbi:hypothetical protein OUZ56_011733 [Daphnia magna]|uniref:Uncharacterized protein n=1 Tax=Daphnia magna TaxID=35525 RepID=A0ABQ9Z127_9CRUS|nr:hypothetical protein OUZ56_011733 [Daphnia magna]